MSLSCRRSAGRLSRHAALNEIIRRALVSHGVPAILTPSGLCREDGKRPDGVSLIPWREGKPLLWDITCVDTFAKSHLSSSSSLAGSAATKAEERKRLKYHSLEKQSIF